MKKIVDNLAFLVATGLGSGLSPKAPGTAGSIAFAGIWALAGFGQFEIQTQALIFAAVLVLGQLSTLQLLAGRYKGIEDPQLVVVDEWAGLALTYLIAGSASVPLLISGLLAFRLFDITKPTPIKRLEQIGGATGIMVDDLAAGVYAGVLVLVVSTFLIGA